MMTQIDLLTKHMMGGGSQSVNAMGVSGGKCSEDEKIEVLYNKEVQFLTNQAWGSRPTYQRHRWKSRLEQRERHKLERP